MTLYTPPDNHPDNHGQGDLLNVSPQDLTCNPDLKERLEQTFEKAEKLILDAVRPNTVRALQSDLDYFWGWASISFGIAEHYPIEHELIYTFVAEHLTGLDPKIDARMVELGVKLTPVGQAHKLSTIRRRLSSLAKKHQLMCPDLDSRYVYHPKVKALMAAAAQQPKHKPAPKDAITRDILYDFIRTLDTSTLKGLLLRAILSVGFASGGRRRTELLAMKMENLTYFPDTDGKGFHYIIKMESTKTHKFAEDVPEIPVMGDAAVFLKEWIDAAGITDGLLFRSITKSGKLRASVSGEWLRKEIKRIQIEAGYAYLDLSPHSLRAGFVTQCGLENVPAMEGMQLSLHKTESTFNRYYRAGKVTQNRASGFMKKN